jgi:hypothetical protein
MFFRQVTRNAMRARAAHGSSRVNRMTQSRMYSSTAASSSSAASSNAALYVGAAAAVGVASLWALSREDEQQVPAVFAGSCVPHVGVPVCQKIEIEIRNSKSKKKKN